MTDDVQPLVIDEIGALCPQPVIALAAALRSAEVVALLADDPAAEYDVPAWCRLSGAELMSTSPTADGGTRYVVRRANTAPTST
jgi:TusA-related sulfurtransferase